MKIKITFLVITIVISAASYYWGYYCGERDKYSFSYDNALLKLSNNLLIRDSLLVDKKKQAKQLLDAQIKLDFAIVVDLYKRFDFKRSEYLRCVVTRKIRYLQEQKELFSNIKMLNGEGYPVTKVNSYLASNCEGPPSHVNWSTMEKNTQK